MHNRGDESDYESPSKSSGVLKILEKIKKFALITFIIAFILFLFFWLLYWVTKPSDRIVSNSVKHEWKKNPIKFKMGNIKVGLKIMPSANTEDNIIIMNYIKNSQGEDKIGNVDKSYHRFMDTHDYFPAINVKKEYVPFGDPDPYGLYLSWATIDKSKMKDKYKPFLGMSRGSILGKGHILWNSNDPKQGIDIKMWRQEVFKLDNCGDDGDYLGESTYRGVYTFNKGYSYSVVEKIGFKVEEESQDSSDDNYKWKIVEGGYDDGSYTKMTKAIPGFEYDFDHVPIEVRAYADPFAGDTEEEEKEAEDPQRKKSSWSFLKFLAWVFFIIFLIAFLIWLIIAIIDGIRGAKSSSENRRLVNKRAEE